MKNKKLIKEDIESIKFMMNYDTRKTLTENREILNEIDFNETNQKIASALWLASTGLGTNPEQIVNSLSQIKTAEQFFDVQNKFVAQSTRNGSTYKGIADMINYEFQSNLKGADLTNRILKCLPTINYVINKIPGLTGSITPGKKEIGSTPIGTINIQYAKVTTDPTKKTTDPEVVGAGGADANTVTKTIITIYEKFPCLKTEYKYIKYVNRTDLKPPAISLYFENIKTKKIYEIFTNGKATDKQTNKMMNFSCGSTVVDGGGTKIPIPPQLKDSAGVKKFQEWVVGIKGDKTILGSYGADGKFGGRTSKAWIKYGNEYLNPKLETLKPLKATTVTPTTPAAGTAQTTDGTTTQPELQLPNNQLQQAAPIDQNMTGKQKRQFNRFSKKQEKMKKRNQNQNQTQTNAIDSAAPQTNTNQPGYTNA